MNEKELEKKLHETRMRVQAMQDQALSVMWEKVETLERIAVDGPNGSVLDSIVCKQALRVLLSIMYNERGKSILPE